MPMSPAPYAFGFLVDGNPQGLALGMAGTPDSEGTGLISAQTPLQVLLEK